MMASPEWYYEENVKGKSVEQLHREIRRLKREISRLKKLLEDPKYLRRDVRSCPGEDVQLSCTEGYLARAKLALEAAGGQYIPTKAETRVAEFQERLTSLSTLIFRVRGRMSDRETKVVSICDEDLRVYAEGFCSLDKSPEAILPRQAQDFILALGNLELGAWRRSYDSAQYGVYVLDGASWELSLHFSDRSKPVRFSGSNAYPYNFDKLRELLEKLWEEAFPPAE